MAKLNASEITQMRIKRIEKEIRDTPYHKGTEHHIGKLRATLAKLKDQADASERISKGGGGPGYAVKKQGDATVTLVGPPSAGKSTLINKLTNAKSKIAPYAFTTVSVIPGMMRYKNANIQILDVPGLIEGAEVGKGRGREVLSVARNSDLLIIMSDIQRPHIITNIVKSLEENGIRINKFPPNVSIEKKIRGGLVVHSNITQDLSKETIAEVAKEYGYGNAEITLRENLTMDTLIDAFSRNRVYIPALFVLNKVDELEGTRMDNIFYIGAESDINLDDLRNKMYDTLGFLLVYLIKADDKPNTDNPMVVRQGETLQDILDMLGEDMAENKKGAEIWGPGAKHPGQKVSLAKEVVDGMQIRFI